MASGRTPHFQNDMGLPSIEIGVKEFMCLGAKPPFDHPHVFLDMGEAGEMVCPYCSTLFKFNPALDAGSANPQAAVWHDEAA